ATAKPRGRRSLGLFVLPVAVQGFTARFASGQAGAAPGNAAHASRRGDLLLMKFLYSSVEFVDQRWLQNAHSKVVRYVALAYGTPPFSNTTRSTNSDSTLLLPHQRPHDGQPVA